MTQLGGPLPGGVWDGQIQQPATPKPNEINGLAC
jgi:hypothetical protein